MVKWTGVGVETCLEQWHVAEVLVLLLVLLQLFNAYSVCIKGNISVKIQFTEFSTYPKCKREALPFFVLELQVAIWQKCYITILKDISRHLICIMIGLLTNWRQSCNVSLKKYIWCMMLHYLMSTKWHFYFSVKEMQKPVV